MKILIFILLPFFSSAQYAQWTTGNESAVISYEVQISTNLNSWTSIDTIQPGKSDTNIYQAYLPAPSVYVRIKANTINSTFYTANIYLYKQPALSILPQTSIIQLL